MKEVFIPKRFRSATAAIIEQANSIIDKFLEQGFKLTVRALHYQFVTRNLIPNNKPAYHRLKRTVNDGRLAGLIDWEAIVDRTRPLHENSHWDSPAEMLNSCAAQFRYDLWDGQETLVEVWIEKDALIEFIEGVCRELDVPYLSCRGFPSQSAARLAGNRARYHASRTVVLHLADHDSSGLEMTRDIQARLTLLSKGLVTVNRIALSLDQVMAYSLPPNFAKSSDTRAKAYIAEFGNESWELDALEPKVMSDLIREHVCKLIEDPELMEEQRERQAQARAELAGFVDDWTRRDDHE